MRSLSWLGVVASLNLACSSQPLDEGQEGAGGERGAELEAGGAPSTTREENPCSAALEQQLSLVDQVSQAAVSVLERNAEELVVYVDASAGGIDGADRNPWVYVSLASGEAVELTDLEALGSRSWDLALKRFVIRTNSGDSGPGAGGALRVTLPWDDVDQSTLGNRTPPAESWFDEDCNLSLDASTGDLITTFSGWSEYDPATHVLAPADAVYLTLAADGSLFKVALLDYYATPSGGHGTIPGRYLLRVAPLP